MDEVTGQRGTGAIPDVRAMQLEIHRLHRELHWLQERTLPALETAQWPRVPDVPPLIFDQLVAATGGAGGGAR